MSQQNACKFIDLILSDKALQERMSDMKPDEVLAVAREQGLECTLEELKEATAKTRELSLDEMEQTAGGKQTSPKIPFHCDKSPTNYHKWLKTAEYKQAEFLFLEGWDVFYVCEHCGRTKRKKEYGWAW